jgi:glycosyltransferase involved in cell wall biosynthesis
VALPLYHALRSSLDHLVDDYEIIFVDDGSVDGTVPEILNIANSDPRVIVVELTRNFGNAMAIATGLELASGEWVVTMDSDFEDKPEDVGELYRKAHEGYDVVYAVRESKHKSFLKDVGSRAFYFLMSRISAIPLPRNTGNFCIMRQDVVRALRKMSERTRYFAGIRTWVDSHRLELTCHGETTRRVTKAIFPGWSSAGCRVLIFYSSLEASYSSRNRCLRLALFVAVLIIICVTHPEVRVEWALTLTAIIFVVGSVDWVRNNRGIWVEYMTKSVKPVTIIKKLTNAKLGLRVNRRRLHRRCFEEKEALPYKCWDMLCCN